MGGRGVCLLLSYSFPFFLFWGKFGWVEFKVRVVRDTVFFWGGGRSGGGRGRRGGGEETSDSSDEFCLVELEFFGRVEAAGVGEGGGEVVGGFGEVRGEREGGDGDDGVFDCGRGEDSAVEVKEEGWGWGGGEVWIFGGGESEQGGFINSILLSFSSFQNLFRNFTNVEALLGTHHIALKG